MRRDCPALTHAEWCAVCDALNWWEGDARAGVSSAWAEIMDADLGAKWDVDAEALAQRVRELPTGAKVALAEVVAAFWRHSDLDTVKALAKAGARIADG